MSQSGDDAQRDLEQRALRNVRGLLDKMEDEERKDTRTTLRIAIACGLVAVAALALVVAYSTGKSRQDGAVVIPAPAKTPR